ncbi:MAG: hypothetical protein ABFC34_07745 [Methanobacterium sp.]|jgi:hypothetical protein
MNKATWFKNIKCPECGGIEITPIGTDKVDINNPHGFMKRIFFFFCKDCQTLFEISED